CDIHSMHALLHLPSFPTRRSSDLFPAFDDFQTLPLLPNEVTAWMPSCPADLESDFRVEPFSNLRKARTRRRSAEDLRTPLPRKLDRKSTRLNSSHEWTSYALFCFK